ncbi:hypothetical protein DE146DRAFT_678726 [Phaeosphaeria sp. MPI-PUGE-AT-0046c]|nr:hypothetical protein DE146DRAFT_678726 [Phaeosphaeria sp. MPI-PUGE-AT-0046c]
MSELRVSQKAQNLARIRDNQRRSRARRKEYLQEIEAKLRSCEQIGIEASSEIQTAARKVIDENRALRSLLHQRGVSESEIVIALGGLPGRSFEHNSAVPMLDTILDRRITCSTLPSTAAPAPATMRAASVPRHMPSVPQIRIPASRPTAMSCCDSPSPGSIVSSMDTPPPPVSYSAAYYTTPSTPPAPVIKSEDVSYGYSYDQSYNNTWHYPHGYNLVADPSSYYTTPSSIDAANVMKSMNSGAERSEATFPSRVSRPNCYMDNNNNVIYGFVDGYSDQV